MKTRHLFLLPAFIFCALLCRAQIFAPVKDAAALKEKIAAASQKINTLKCDFQQEKKLSMLTEKAVSKGKFYFKRDDKVRLEYQQPAKNLIVMNAGKMLTKDEKKTQQTDMHRSRAFQQLNNIIVGSINGTLFSGKDFSVKFSESATQVQVELIPINKMLKNFLSNIVLILEKKDFTAASITMNETSGDATILNFSNKELNPVLLDELFAIK